MHATLIRRRSAFLREAGLVMVFTAILAYLAYGQENLADFRPCSLQKPRFFRSGNPVLAL